MYRGHTITQASLIVVYRTLFLKHLSSKLLHTDLPIQIPKQDLYASHTEAPMALMPRAIQLMKPNLTEVSGILAKNITSETTRYNEP